MGNALGDNRKYLASPQQQQGPSGCASRLEHPLNAGVHFFLFDKLASCNLVDANLDLCLEPFVMSKQLGNRFLYQLVGSPSCLGGKLIQLDFLILRQMYFHILSVGMAAACVKHDRARVDRAAPSLPYRLRLRGFSATLSAARIACPIAGCPCNTAACLPTSYFSAQVFWALVTS